MRGKTKTVSFLIFLLLILFLFSSCESVIKTKVWVEEKKEEVNGITIKLQESIPSVIVEYGGGKKVELTETDNSIQLIELGSTISASFNPSEIIVKIDNRPIVIYSYRWGDMQDIEKRTERLERHNRFHFTLEFIILLLLIYLISTILSGCDISYPEKNKEWIYKEENIVPEGITFSLGNDNLVILSKDGKEVMTLKEGDYYSNFNPPYMINAVYKENKITIYNNEEVIALYSFK